MQDEVVLRTDFADLGRPKRGKVRDIYDLGDRLLIVATDRISAFDVVLPDGIPMKGKVLTQLSRFWFDFASEVTPNHLITAEVEEMGEKAAKHREALAMRSMLVRKAEVVPVECVVRGYLAGSGWREYKEKGEVCGVKLPRGLRESEELPEPIFTPQTKAQSGHDININFEEACDVAGAEAMEEIGAQSLRIYELARGYARDKGIIICDTKMEWGRIKGDLVLIDELLTPDSSRFWPLEEYEPGRPQPSFDKQFVRDYLEEIGWNKEPPAPMLPGAVVRKTTAKYLEAYRRLTGKELRG